MHNDYPLAPEKFEISKNMLSKYCSNIATEYRIKVGGVIKLVPNLGNKSKYVLHCKNFKLYLSLGMKSTKVHRILKMPIYVEFSILDLSKLLMYEFHYNYIKSNLDAN